MNRYSRQTIFYGIGVEGQERLGMSRVLIIGAGALGTGVANNLVRAGVGHVKLIDGDFVELGNLHRQSLFDETDAKEKAAKATAVLAKLQKVNSEVRLEAVVSDLNPGNVFASLAGIDLVIDGTDNVLTRLLINDACWKLTIPWIYGGAVGSAGMVSVFIPGKTPCLRCLFNSPAALEIVQTCETAGIINPASGMVSNLQTAEALKILVGAHTRVNTGLSHFDLWENKFDNIDLKGMRTEECPCCGKVNFE